MFPSLAFFAATFGFAGEIQRGQPMTGGQFLRIVLTWLVPAGLLFASHLISRGREGWYYTANHWFTLSFLVLLVLILGFVTATFVFRLK